MVLWRTGERSRKNVSQSKRASRRKAFLRGVQQRRYGFESLEERRMLALDTWTGNGGDNLWTDAANWSTAAVPNSTDDVSISAPGSPTITLSGTISVNSLTSSDPIDVSSGSLTVAGGESSLTDGLTIAAGASLTATGSGTTFTASGATDIDGANLDADNGADLTLSDLTSYNNTLYYVTTVLEASGAGSTLSLPALTSIAMTYEVSGIGVALDAGSGGGDSLNLPSLATVSNGPALIAAGGTGSNIDLSSLASLPAGSSVSDTGGALIQLNSTFANTPTIDGVAFTVDGTDSNMNAFLNQLTSLTDGSLTVTGGSYTLNNLNDVNGSSFYVQNGGSLALPGVTTYTNDTSDNTYLSATGTGSVLNLENLTTAAATYVAYISAEGTSSEINLSDLQSLPSVSSLSDTDGAELLLDSDLTTLDGDSITVDGTDSNINAFLGQLTTLTNGSLTVSGGVYTLPNLTDIDGSSLYVQSGGNLALPDVTTYNNNESYSSTELEATGSGSTLSLVGLASIANTGEFASTSFEASNSNVSTTETSVAAANASDDDGATLNLPDLTEVTGVPLVVDVAGAGNQMDLSSLQSLPSGSSLSDTSQASLLLNSLSTTLDGVSITVDGTDSNIDAFLGQLASFTNGSLTVEGGSYTLSDLTDIDNSSLYSQLGGSLALPDLTTYTESNANASVTLQATGTGSVISLPALTSFEITSNDNGNVDFEALEGGNLLLSALTALSDPGNGYPTVESDGSDSEIDLSSVQSFTTDNGLGQLTVTNSGTLLTGQLRTLNGVNVTVDDTAIWSTSSITSSSNGTYTLVGYGPPSSGNAVTVDVPTLPEGLRGLAIDVIFNSSYTGGTTINVPAGQTFGMSGGSFSGGTVFNVPAGAALTISGGTFTGGATFNVGQGATVDLTNSENMSGALTGSGTGTVQIVNTSRLYIGAGGMSLDFPGDMLEWNNGIIDAGAGSLTNLGTLTLVGNSGEDFFNDGTLDNFGTIIQIGAGSLYLGTDNLFPTVLENETGASYLIEANSGVGVVEDRTGTAAVPEIVNAGTLRKTAGNGTSTVDLADGSLANTGTIEADSGTLQLAAGTVRQISGDALTGGVWNALNGATLELPSGTSITSNQANLALGGSGASITGISALSSNSGAFAISGDASFTTTGDFANSGTITLASGGILNGAGNFTQTSAGASTSKSAAPPPAVYSAGSP